jgi:phosphatidylglycerophosphatase A
VLYLGLGDQSPVRYLFFLLTLFLIGCYTAGIAEKTLKAKDSRHIVIDEIHGMLLTLWALPHSFSFLITGFLLFRLFDIWKPFPGRYLEQRAPGGWGVMLDDTVAALYANGILQGASLLHILT